MSPSEGQENTECFRYIRKLNVDILYCILKEILTTRQNIAILKVLELLNLSQRPKMRDCKTILEFNRFKK